MRAEQMNAAPSFDFCCHARRATIGLNSTIPIIKSFLGAQTYRERPVSQTGVIGLESTRHGDFDFGVAT
jgi:hypothetical protein